MMFSLALVQIATALAFLQDYQKARITSKPLAINSLLSTPAAWHLLCSELLWDGLIAGDHHDLIDHGFNQDR
jgi:hypothetical protein